VSLVRVLPDGFAMQFPKRSAPKPSLSIERCCVMLRRKQTQ
jgi:hypothetical protein